MVNLYVIATILIFYVVTRDALLIFQQNRYETTRYTNWMKEYGAKKVFNKWVFILLALVTIIHLTLKDTQVEMFLVTIFALKLTINDLDKKYIKPLVYTRRVKTQLITMIILEVISAVVFLYNEELMPVITLAYYYLAYLLIYVMNIITMPIEKAIYNWYIKDAKKVMAKNPFLIKIGITGSYGKTSSKHIITDIVNEGYYTLMTPHSYNTPMGICKCVRGSLKPIHEAFVCEMGADKVGDIKELMDFVNPSIGIVTSIGPQHLLTFKSLENIINEKMLEIEMLPSDGLGIINIDNEYIRNHKIKNNVKVVTVGIASKDADYFAYNIRQSEKGTTFKVKLNNQEVPFKTRLLGKHNVLNILMAIALGNELHINVDSIVKAVSTLKYVEHRLELKDINDFTFIDNAFNSNPVSSKLSLDTLAEFKKNRVVVTPGFIDLGDKQDEYNYDFGKYMLNKADEVILVGKNQTKMIYKGLVDSEFDQNKIHVVDKVVEAFNIIYQTMDKDNSIILLENDLPDIFNS